MMKFFEGQGVVAFMSDRRADFQPTDFDLPLTSQQQEYIKTECGLEVKQVFWRKQVHGDTVLVAQDSSKGLPDADSYITSQQGLVIAIRTADCVPVFLFDPVKKAIGLAHAGWKGTYQEITYKTVNRMKEVFGSRPEDIHAVLGPSIGPCCYEVGPEFRQYFPNEITEHSGKLFTDVPKSNYRQLLKAGLNKENIINTGVCTFCNAQYFSFRRDGEKAGRMISLMQIL
jgi:YfiH family protein